MSDTPPFEGAEKLLEVWFAPSAADVPDANCPEHGRTGLRKVEKSVWEEMLDIVRCKVLSTVQGQEMDAYLLSESSLFISPHRIILKTCGTTLNLLGLPRILEIASTHANMHVVYRCFYSRKSFMFPDRQQGPHRDWKDEVQFLDNIFQDGAAYTVGNTNGDHWLLYMSSPRKSLLPRRPPDHATFPDYTIEILMSDLASAARQPFHSPPSLLDSGTPAELAQSLSASSGISDIFPPSLTTLDSYAFSPCGYSANALVKWNQTLSDSHVSTSEGYYTIHVTPEEGWSYASFECNIPLSSPHAFPTVPDLKTLIQRVVAVFQPSRLSVTLFISSEDDKDENSVEAAQKAFKAALTDNRTGQAGSRLYRRTDKINYEFGDYDLAFASFELL